MQRRWLLLGLVLCVGCGGDDGEVGRVDGGPGETRDAVLGQEDVGEASDGLPVGEDGPPVVREDLIARDDRPVIDPDVPPSLTPGPFEACEPGECSGGLICTAPPGGDQICTSSCAGDGNCTWLDPGSCCPEGVCLPPGQCEGPVEGLGLPCATSGACPEEAPLCVRPQEGSSLPDQAYCSQSCGNDGTCQGLAAWSSCLGLSPADGGPALGACADLTMSQWDMGRDLGPGEACSTDLDCSVSGAVMVCTGAEALGNAICTRVCTDGSHCQDIFPGGCCLPSGARSVCASVGACNPGGPGQECDKDAPQTGCDPELAPICAVVSDNQPPQCTFACQFDGDCQGPFPAGCCLDLEEGMVCAASAYCNRLLPDGSYCTEGDDCQFCESGNTMTIPPGVSMCTSTCFAQGTPCGPLAICTAGACFRACQGDEDCCDGVHNCESIVCRDVNGERACFVD